MEQTGSSDSATGPLGPRADREAYICNTRLSLTISEADISAACGIPRKGKEKHRPLIVILVSQRIRNLVYRSGTPLRKSSDGKEASTVYINEHLSSQTLRYNARVRSLIKENRATAA